MSDSFVLNDRYELIERIGEPSGMGEVWRGYDPTLRRQVAIKTTTNPALARRLVTEARNVATVQHPYIVNVYDYGDWTIDEMPFPSIVMELVDGPALSQLVRDGATVDPLRALRLTGEILDALAWSHQHKLVHGDIKLANVLVSPLDHAKVVDFGIAVPLSERLEQPAPPTWLSVIGTPLYAAPEQWGGVINAASDIWQCGVLLFELVTGTAPFPEEPLETLLQRIQQANYQVPGQVPEAVHSVIAGALQPDPVNRFASPAAMRAAIDDAERSLLSSANIGSTIGTERVQLRAEPDLRSSSTVELVFPARLNSRLYVRARSSDDAGWTYLGLTTGRRRVPSEGEFLLELVTEDVDCIEQVLFELDVERLSTVVLDHPNERSLDLLASRMTGVRDLRMTGDLRGANFVLLRKLHRLGSLTLAHTGIDDDDLETIGSLGALRSLDLAGTNITDAGIGHLLGLVQLRTLDVRDTAISQAGLSELSSLPFFNPPVP